MRIDPTPGLSSPRLFTHSNPYVYYKGVSSTCDWARANNGNPLPAGFNIKQVDVSNDMRYVLYVSGWASGSLYVMDGYVHGALGSMNWADRTPPLPAGSTRNDAIINADRSVRQPATVYYTTGGARPSRAFMSTDRGLTWTDVTGDLTTILPNAHYLKLIGNPANLDQLFLATNVGIFRSDNGGVNWYNYSDGLPAVVDVTDLELNYDVSSPPMLHIGTYGRGFWERALE